MRARRVESGFTLIEILVVIIIVGIVLSVMLLSINNVGSDRKLRSEGQRFAALLEVSLDEASLQGREYGLELLTAGYRFVEFDPLLGIWSDIIGDDTLRLRALPEELEFELYLEEQRVLLENDPAPFEDPDAGTEVGITEVYSPHLLIYSSGDTTPFELHIRRTSDDARVILRGNTLGGVEVLSEDAARSSL